MRMWVELAGAQSARGSTSIASPAGSADARSTTSAVSRSPTSAPAVSSSASTSVGAAEEKGTKPLLRGPKNDGVRNMKLFLSPVSHRDHSWRRRDSRQVDRLAGHRL